MMSIENNLRKIAAGKFGEYSYVFEDWKGAAERVDRVALPAIITLLPASGKFEFNYGKVKDSEDVAIAFIDKVARDANGNDNEAVYSRMKQLACMFIKALNESGYFEPIGGAVKYSTILESASANFTGVFVELRIKELTGVCM